MKAGFEQYLDWLWYPLVMTGAFLIYMQLVSAGAGVFYSAYIPVILAGIGITFLEKYFPQRKNWLPNHRDILNDAGFMLIVQILLPQLLGYMAAYMLLIADPRTAHFWPRELPVVIQLVFMLLIADFLRYWLHRACHKYVSLWQLHAVHHSPHKLYWLNVGRFHPVEKAFQFVLDVLPFILLGIGKEVLSLYFVFYAINGFFQHSNIRIRMGWLNYLISGPELHRWHHSVKVDESDRNFGNNLIVWDLCFGTYFMPVRREVGELGLKNRGYPSSFILQMKTPFIPRLESRALPLVSWSGVLANLLLKLRFLRVFFTQWSLFINSTRKPRAVQEKLLRRIMALNRTARFGRDHHFASIATYKDFCRNVPVQSYDSLFDYISLHDPGRQGLTVADPCFYQVTSGTTGAAKYLPVTSLGLRMYKIQQNMFALARYLDAPCAYTGKIFAVVSPAVEGHTDNGTPYGSASGLVYMQMPIMARSKYVVPYPLFEIEDYEVKYLLTALFAVSDPRVTMAASANPSTFVRLLNVINEHCDQLLHMLASGDINIAGFDCKVHSEIAAHFRADALRARELKNQWASRGRLTYRDIWPHLQSLVTWTGGSCSIALSSLKPDLPEFTEITDMGYLASEIRGTIILGKQTGVPVMTHNFYEFVERDDWESGRQKFELLDKLEIGKQYYIIVTTVNGLYRYFMNDIVEVTGRFHATPTFRFLQKGRGATNITGEKLYESQALDAIKEMEAKYAVSVRFYQWLADEENSRYLVFIELGQVPEQSVGEYEHLLDALLSELNIEYAQKRKSGRLKGVSVRFLRAGAGELFKKFCVQNGQREGQFKTVTLGYLKDCDFDFESHVLNVEPSEC